MMFGDTKPVTGASPQFSWTELYRAIRDTNFPDASIEELLVYKNIRKSHLHRAATRPELFPCSEVIGWIIQRTDATSRMISDTTGEGLGSFQAGHLDAAYNLPHADVMLTTQWVKDANFNYLEFARKMTIPGKQLRTKKSGEYDTEHLRTTFRLIALMLSRIYGLPDGNIYKLSWAPVMCHVATHGTVFNWSAIISDSLSTNIVAAQRGVAEDNVNFHMSGYLLDCILIRYPFPGLGCVWNTNGPPVHVAYQMLWGDRYKSHYKRICESFIIPLYRLMFKEEPCCMSENAMKVIEQYGDYYLCMEGLYIRMFGGSKAPSMMPQYATDFVVHKEAVRQVYVNGVGHFLAEKKKLIYPPMPFVIGAYKLAKAKEAEAFVEDLEGFHFGAKSFRRHDPDGKMQAHCGFCRIGYEYGHLFWKDEEFYRSAKNMIDLNNRYRLKKGTSSSPNVDKDKEVEVETHHEQVLDRSVAEVEKKKKEAEVQKVQQEENEKVVKEASDRLLREETEEEGKSKQQEEANSDDVQNMEVGSLESAEQDRIREAEIKSKQEEEAKTADVQNMEVGLLGSAEEGRIREEEVKANQEEEPKSPHVQNMEVGPLGSTEQDRIREEELKSKQREEPKSADVQNVEVGPLESISGGYCPLPGLELVPYSPSKENEVANLDSIFFYPDRKVIIRKSEKRMKCANYEDVVTVIETPILEGINNDPKFAAAANVAMAQASAHNVDELVGHLEIAKATLSKVRENLHREENRGKELKRKYSDLLSEKEKMVEDLWRLDDEKDKLAVQVMILEGENNDFEAATTQLKSKQLATDQQVQELKLKVEELEKENGGLTKRLETGNNRKVEITVFCDEACKVIEQMYHFQVTVMEKVYNLKQMMVQMDEIAVEAQAARGRQFDVAEKVKRHMVWRETNSEYPAELVPKTVLDLKSEMQLLEFCRKASLKLNTDITRTTEACMGFYKRIQKVYEKCHLCPLPPIDELPAEELQMTEINTALQGELEYIRKLDTLIEEDVHHMVGQVSIHAYLLEESCVAAEEGREYVETQLSYHEVALQVLEPSRVTTIAEQANAWDKFFL